MLLLSETIKWEYSDETIRVINKSKTPILVITGVSGSGKSYLAEHLLQQFPCIVVVKNYTTRPPRKSDNPDHFEYVSESVFNDLLDTNQFFLARHMEYPFYGYLKKDVLNAVDKKQVPLFMFRHSGVKMIYTLLQNVYTIAIKSSPDLTINHSRDEISVKSEQIATISQNQIFAEVEQHPNCLILTNNYDEQFVNNENLSAFITELRL